MNACECGTDCRLKRGDLVCDYCKVPYEWAQQPIEMSMTLMGGGHNRKSMACQACVRWFRNEGRRSTGRPIPAPPWSKS